MPRTVVALGVGLLLAACFESNDSPPVCHDEDGDRYGEGSGCAGPDCDDGDPAVRALCPPHRCADAPEDRGCPCLSEAAPLLCYDGPPETSGVGRCVPGLRSCVSGSWSACEGEIVPALEGCNFEDDDCDGEVDEDVRSSCGDCNPECAATCVGVGCEEAFRAGEGGALDPDGTLRVGQGRDLTPHLLWIVSDLRGLVTRVDTGARRIDARYAVAQSTDDTDAQAVAMNAWGDALVVAATFQGPARAWATFVRAADCDDVNGDGAVTTSQGWADLLDWGEDDCLAWSVELSSSCQGGCSAGGVAFATEGSTAWAAAGTNRIEELDVGAGALTGRFLELPETALALLADATRLWIATPTSLYVAPLDDLDAVDAETTDLWGISRLDLDEVGRIYAGAPLGRWDPAARTFEASVAPTFDFGLDPDGTPWVLDATDPSSLARLDDDLEDAGGIGLDQFYFSISPDLDGQLWTARPGENHVSVWDGATGDPVAVLDDPACDVSCPDHPMLHGDPAALRYRRAFGGVVAATTVTHVFDLGWCGWGRGPVTISWEAEGDPPPRLRARLAWSQDALTSAELFDLPASPTELSMQDWPDPQLHLELQADLRGRDAALHRIDVVWSCETQGF